MAIGTFMQQLLARAIGEIGSTGNLWNWRRQLSQKVDELDARGDALDWKNSVRVATAAALPTNVFIAPQAGFGGQIEGAVVGALPTIDGVALAVGDSLLVKNEQAGDPASHGIYVVTSLGSAGTKWLLTRRDDANTSSDVTAGMIAGVTEGTVNVDTAWWLITPDPIVLNVTQLLFAPFPIVTSNAQAFVFRPTSVDHGNVYGTWAALVTAVAKVADEPKTIYFDDSLAAVAIPAGAYSFGRAVSWEGILPAISPNSLSTSRVVVTVANGATFDIPPIFIGQGLRVIYSGIAGAKLFPVPVVGPGQGYKTTIQGLVQSTTALASIFGLVDGSKLWLKLEQGGYSSVGLGLLALVAPGAGGTTQLQIDVFNPDTQANDFNGGIPANVLSGPVGPSYLFEQNFFGRINVTQGAMPTGVITVATLTTTASIDYLSKGTAAIVNGVSAAIAANISATSSVVVTVEAPVPGAGNLTVHYGVLAANRVNGAPGSFKITALIAAGTINVLDQSTAIRWAVVGP